MEVKKTNNMGFGVFATKNYCADEIIEDCNVIELDATDTNIIDKTKLYNYYFSWDKDGNGSAIALGNGSLYNHSYKPNAKYEKHIDKQIIIVSPPFCSKYEI